MLSTLLCAFAGGAAQLQDTRTSAAPECGDGAQHALEMLDAALAE